METTTDRRKEYRVRYGVLNRDELRERARLWRRDNPEKYALMLQRKRERQKVGYYKERDREYYLRNREACLARNKMWVEKNRVEQNRKALRKYHSDPLTNIRVRIMSRLSESIKVKKPRRNKWCEVLGFTVEELKSHLESKFCDGMTWDNYGKWHIDHIIPVSAFTFSSVDDPDFRECWKLENLQPLWAVDNMRKHAKGITVIPKEVYGRPPTVEHHPACKCMRCS
jgi:hypothetical protein